MTSADLFLVVVSLLGCWLFDIVPNRVGSKQKSKLKSIVKVFKKKYLRNYIHFLLDLHIKLFIIIQ